MNILLLAVAALLPGVRAAGTSAISIAPSFTKHLDDEGKDICDGDPDNDVCQCPCNSDLITITQQLSGAKRCIMPDALLNPDVPYDDSGGRSKK